MRDLAGRVAVVTGGASGIGSALAERFARAGMKIAVGDVDAPALEAVVARLRHGGAEAVGVPTDVSDADQVQQLADTAVERFGAIHVACNNAGVGGGGLSWEVPLTTWQWVLGVNLWGVVHGVRAFVPVLTAQDEGHLVNTASVAGLVAAPFMGPYNASKHAVVAISETLHHELAMTAPHVKVSVLCPGWVNTRIADSERNRPAHLREGDTVDDAPIRDLLRARLASGLAPEAVAEMVLDAIRTERFWVLTHDDQDDQDDFWVASLDRRLRSLAERANPTLGPTAPHAPEQTPGSPVGGGAP